MLLNIFVFALIALAVFGVRPIRPLKQLNENYLLLETTVSLRGIFALSVVLHHLSQRTNPVYPYSEFLDMGYLAVAVFFFFSGYGLQKKHLSSPEYSKGFLLKRFPSVLVPALIMAAVFWCKHAVGGKIYTVKDILMTVLTDNTTHFFPNSWYIINLVIFYVYFYLMMKLFKQKKLLMVVGSLAFYCIWMLYCMFTAHGVWWYNATQLLVVGIFWASYEEQLVKFIKKVYFIVAPLIWGSFLLVFNFRKTLESLPTGYALFFTRVLTATLFVLGIIMFTLKFKIGNPVLQFLGKHSYEIYLVHGFFVSLFRNNPVIENDFLYISAVLCSSLIGAFLFRKAVNGFVLQQYNKLYSKHFRKEKIK